MAVAVVVCMRLAVEVFLQRRAFQVLDFEQAVQVLAGIDQAFGAQGAALVDQRGVRQLPIW